MSLISFSLAACILESKIPSGRLAALETSYRNGQQVFFEALKKGAAELASLEKYDRTSLAEAERSCRGLYEQLMDFYPYAVRCDGREALGEQPILVLALRLASEFLDSIPAESRVAGVSPLEAAMISSGCEVRRSGPEFQRFVRTTAQLVRNGSVWKDLEMDTVRGLSTGRGVKIALIDTGLDPTLKDIRRRVAGYRDFLAGERPFWGTRRFPYDWGGHGTAVASVVSQVAPEADLLIARVYDEESMERVPGSWWTVNLFAAGVTWAVDQGADIINLSFAIRNDVPRLKALARTCFEKNVILVTSMGNVFNPSDTELPYYPAAYPWPIAVGGVRKSGDGLHVWEYSARGDYVDVVAPAASIWVEQPSYLEQNRFPQRAYGNSLATALVSGTVALVLAAMDDREKEGLRRTPGALCERVHEIICRTASNAKLGLAGFNSQSGHGLIDPLAAVREARQGRR